MSANDYDVLQELDRQGERQMERVRRELQHAGRQDLVDELNAKLRDIRLGITGAQATWEALSGIQRFALKTLSERWFLSRSIYYPPFYDAYGPPDVVWRICGFPTLKCLLDRKLCDLDGEGRDPFRKVTINERGRFVHKFGAELEIIQ